MMFSTNHCAPRSVSVRRLLRTLLVCCLLSAAGAAVVPATYAAGFSNGFTDRTISVGGRQRTYHVHVPPSYTGTTALPLVVALHGSYDNGRNMAGLTHFNDVADRFGVIAAYPDAVNGTWNTDTTSGPDDVAFISAMLQQMKGTYTINSHRIYATGFSNGAVMTEELGCRLSSQFAAIASVSGHMTSTFAATCKPVHAMPWLSFHGTADPMMSFTGWADAKFGNAYYGAVGAQDKWASLAGCTAGATTTNLPNAVVSDGTTEQLRARGSCASGAQTQLYIINNGGHTWPGGLQYTAVSLIGLTSQDIDASTLIWQFFARFQH